MQLLESSICENVRGQGIIGCRSWRVRICCMDLFIQLDFVFYHGRLGVQLIECVVERSCKALLIIEAEISSRLLLIEHIVGRQNLMHMFVDTIINVATISNVCL